MRVREIERQRALKTTRLACMLIDCRSQLDEEDAKVQACFEYSRFEYKYEYEYFTDEYEYEYISYEYEYEYEYNTHK